MNMDLRNLLEQTLIYWLPEKQTKQKSSKDNRGIQLCNEILDCQPNNLPRNLLYSAKDFSSSTFVTGS